MFVAIRAESLLILDQQENVGKKRERWKEARKRSRFTLDQNVVEISQIVQNMLPGAENLHKIAKIFDKI